MKSQKRDGSRPKFKVFDLVKRHKIWTVVGLLAAVALTLTAVDYYHTYVAYKERLTDKDFAAISEMAENVLKQAGAKDVTKYEECSYKRPEVFADLHLYCNINLVGYMPYESNEQATNIAKDLENTASEYGEIFTYSRDFFEDPRNKSAQFLIDLEDPLPPRQCSFSIYTNERAQDAVLFVPKRPENDLIALTFFCSAQSRGEYFPVTYRQGQ